MRKIAIANRKGGVGKTTTAVHLAHGLSMTGRRTLLIDADTQGHCARILGDAPTLVDYLDKGTPPAEVRPNLFFLAGSRELSGIEREIARMDFNGHLYLSERLAALHDYAYVVVDTAPAHSILGLNVLFYADELLVPVSMEILAMAGLADLVAELKRLEKAGPAPIRYVTPTFADGRTRKTLDVIADLEKHFGDLVTGQIRVSADMSRLPYFHQTMFEWDPRNRAAMDYALLTRRIANGQT